MLSQMTLIFLAKPYVQAAGTWVVADILTLFDICYFCLHFGRCSPFPLSWLGLPHTAPGWRKAGGDPCGPPVCPTKTEVDLAHSKPWKVEDESSE